MVTESPTLFPEIREVQAPGGRGLHGYYRKINGWIVTAPTSKGNREDYEYKGFQLLNQYGQFKNVSDVTHEVDNNGVGWNSFQEPWRLLFQRGGAKEFPIEQIIAYHWHIKPPYREVTFPQLDGVQIYDLFCPECENGVFSSRNEMEAARMLRQHLMSKINTAHDYRAEDLLKLGQEWGIDFFSQRVGQRSVRRGGEDEEGTLLPQANPHFSDDTKFTCRECGNEFDSAKALGGHKMGAHRNPAPV